MKINMAIWDRTIRLTVGTLLVAWAVAGGPWWGYFGLLLLVTAAWRLCPVYKTLGIKTCR